MIRINILNGGMQKVAILENAYDIVPRNVLNGIGSLQFTIPFDDPKRVHIKPFAYVELAEQDGKRIDLYRVLPSTRVTGGEGGALTVECEHVLATLLDDAMPGWHELGGTGIYTPDAINYVLGFQTAQNWILGDCDFYDQYQYGWQHEKCLTALQGIFAALSEYRIDYDVSGYPWVLHVRRMFSTGARPAGRDAFFAANGAHPTMRIAWRYNTQDITKVVDPNSLVTRLYCYGYGEGVNQLNIADINGGLHYLDDAEGISTYGVKCGYYIDRSIEDADTLLAAGAALLPTLAKPKITYTVTAANLYETTRNELDRPAVGKIVKVYDVQDGELLTYITSVEGYEQQIVTLSNVPDNVASTIAEIADRQRIEQTYAQGATNLYAVSFADNADATHPATLDIWIPSETRQINKVMLAYGIERFRADVAGAADGGGRVTTTSEGGGSQTTSNSGGGQTTSSGGASQQTSSTSGQTSRSTENGGGQQVTQPTNTSGPSTLATTQSNNQVILRSTGVAIRQGFFVGNTGPASTPQHTHPTPDHYHDVTNPPHTHGMNHTHTIPSFVINLPNHSHDFTVPGHTHTVSIPAHVHNAPAHTHTVNIPSHTHQINLPDHTHAMIYGIYEGPRANALSLRVGDTTVPLPSDKSEIDIVDYLSKDDQGKIRRGTYHRVEIVPDALTRITATVTVQMFVQSRGGGNY